MDNSNFQANLQPRWVVNPEGMRTGIPELAKAEIRVNPTLITERERTGSTTLVYPTMAFFLHVIGRAMEMGVVLTSR